MIDADHYLRRAHAHVGRALAASALTVIASLALAAEARAGRYVATSCHPSEPGLGALESSASSGTTDDYRWAVADHCGHGGGGVRFGLWATGEAWPNTYAQVAFTAPAGLRFTGGSFRAAVTMWANLPCWECPLITRQPFVHEHFYRLRGDSTLTPGADVPDGYSWPAWGSQLPGKAPVDADQFVIRAGCEQATGCLAEDPGDVQKARQVLETSSFAFVIEDSVAPQIGALSGTLMREELQRETQTLDVTASDVGSGVHSIEVRVNGERYAVHAPNCAVAANGQAATFAPCPRDVVAHIPIDTTRAPFVEGPNSLEVCVRDYAQEGDNPATWAGKACTTTPVAVDNSCAVSQSAIASKLKFAFSKSNRERRTISYGREAEVAAKLAAANGEPISGATVCVATRDRVKGAGEREIGEPQSDAAGKARAKLPTGPSREVKLTYWADSEHVETRRVRLGVRAKPTLHVLSKRKLTDGGKVRFRVELVGPYRAHRRVAVQALAPAGWLDFPGCVGKTGTKGVFKCFYRFREQSGDVEYSFRALAPRQRDYPYLQGRTRPVEVSVSD